MCCERTKGLSKWYNRLAMAKSPEGNPTQGIVDIETFAHFLVEYTSEILINPRNQIYLVKSLDDLERNLPEELKDLTPDVYLELCPWETVPESIQTIIKRGYASAELPEKKRIQVLIKRHEVFFLLKSPSIVDDMDTYGEELVLNVGLQVSGDSSLLFAPVGMWFIHKTPASAALAMKGKTAEEKRAILQQTPPIAQIFPHTLPELNDLTKFLQQSRHTAIVYRQF